MTAKKTNAGAAEQAGREQFERAIAAGQEQFETAASTVLGTLDEVTAYSRRNLDAAMRASLAMTRGVEEISRSWFAFTQGTVEQGVATWRAMMGARNLRELVELQNEYARSTFDQLLNESTKLSDMTLKVANEAMAPLNGRFNEAVERATRAAA